MGSSDFERERDSYAEMFTFEAMIDSKALRLLNEDPTFRIEDEPVEDQDEIRGRATDMMLSVLANARWCEEEGCEHD